MALGKPYKDAFISCGYVDVQGLGDVREGGVGRADEGGILVVEDGRGWRGREGREGSFGSFGKWV